MRRLSQKAVADKQLGYWRREQRAGARPEGAEAAFAAARPRHVLVAGAAGGGRMVLAGLVGMCSFQPRGPKAGPAPEYDAPAALRADAAQLGFPIRLPKLPDGWHANSGRRDSIEDGRTDTATGHKNRAVVSTVGYLAPSGMYLSLTQSNADEEKLVEKIDSGVVSTGAQDVDGVSWVVYEGGENTTARLKALRLHVPKPNCSSPTFLGGQWVPIRHSDATGAADSLSKVTGARDYPSFGHTWGRAQPPLI